MEIPEYPKPAGFFQSNTARMIMVGGLTLILLIPLFFVQDLIRERAQRQKDVVAETTEKWGKSVYLYGPVIKVPYRAYAETVSVDEKTKVATTLRTAQTQFAYFFPETLNNHSSVTSKLLKRSHYESVVYSAKMDIDGGFVQPDFSAENIPESDIDWDKATIIIRTTNLKSIAEEVQINLGGTNLAFEPTFGSENDSIETLETAHLGEAAFATGLDFRFHMTYNGSREIRFVPIGKTTTVHMRSDWASPGFAGNFLPSDQTKKITAKGFTADWKILHVNRAFGQQSFGVLPHLAQYAFGVDFVIPVNEYQQNERAAKYGFLMIGLTFLIFFLIQVISKVRIHIFQYTMIGLALVLFYTLLVSITEHSSFSQAYCIAAIAVVAMISLYAVSILKNRKFPVFIGLSLSVLYGFIYVIIQLEDYALLVGSLGLFAILGAVMYFSRKIDWS